MTTRVDTTLNQGTTIAIRGSVVDASFPADLPPVGTRLATGEDQRVVLEVVSHVDARTVRCIALTPTRGLAPGDAVTNTGRTLDVPVVVSCSAAC